MTASGGYTTLQSVRNAYDMGKVRMVASEFETSTCVIQNHGPSGRGAAVVELGGIVLWTTTPGMWYAEVAVGGSKVHAGCNAATSFGYFSQRTGLIVHIEDSHLTRIQPHRVLGDHHRSSLDDYRAVEGIMITHAGRSVVTLFRFGEAAMSHTKTRIEEVAFNMPGLSVDCFIPPADIQSGSVLM